MAMHACVFNRRCFNRASLAQKFVRLGAHVGAVVLQLADLRRLSLSHTWLCSALLTTMSSSALFDATPSCPHGLSGPVLHTYVSDSSTQSPDALFSIILKPPTGVFSTTDRPPAVDRPPTGHRPAADRLPTGHRLYPGSPRESDSLRVAPVFYTSFILFLPGIVPIHFPVTYAFPSHGGIRLSSLRFPRSAYPPLSRGLLLRASSSQNGPAALWWKANRLPRGSGSLDRYMLIAA